MSEPLATSAEADEQIAPGDQTVAQGNSVTRAAPRVGLLKYLGQCISSASEWLFGSLTLMLGLALLATIPIFQMLSLGYLLEVCGRVAHSGRVRDGFIGIRKAARIGSMLAGTTLLLSPLILTKHMGQIAYLIDPSSSAVGMWRVISFVLLVVMGILVLSAWYQGGRLRDFLWPLWLPITLLIWPLHRRPLVEWFPPAALFKALFQRRWFSSSRDAFWDFVVGLRLPYYFWLGLRGFLGAVIWLLLPVSMLVHAIEQPQGSGTLIGLIGGALFIVVLLVLPFLQTHFAAERRFKAMFATREVRKLFRRAPFAFAISLVLTLLLASPLYLLKIEATPREVASLPALLFVIFNFPTRLVTGWAVARARQRDKNRHFVFRWMARLLMIPTAAIYVLLVFFTQYSSWYGTWSLLEQHAFLVPVPFLELRD